MSDRDPLESAVWFKSSRSDQGGQCVEIASAEGVVGVRDSKDPDGGILRISAGAFRAFVEGAKAGEFDR